MTCKRMNRAATRMDAGFWMFYVFPDITHALTLHGCFAGPSA